MRFVYPEIRTVFDTDIPQINTLIIEAPQLMMELTSDIFSQINGANGRAVLSDQGKILDMSKNAEILNEFYSFDISSKKLIAKVQSEIERKALSGENYESSMEMLNGIENHIRNMARDLSCNIDFPKLSYLSILKATGLNLIDDSHSLGERIVSYITCIKELFSSCFFITINLRNYIDDNEASLLLETLKVHKIDILMIESIEKSVVKYEKRHIVDENFCLIQ